MLLPHVPSSVGVARRQLGGDLRAHAVREASVADAALVLSELLSNAIRHAHPLPGAQIRVAWSLQEDTLEIEVSDGGSATWPRPSRTASKSSLGGRGLSIVDLLSRAWGVRDDDPGVTVWAVLSAARSRRPASANGVSALTSR